MKDVLFSICVPVYNVEKYLIECIDSVLKQSYGMFELILVDDGSTDNSYQICKDYQSKDNRVKVFTKENGGQLSAREFAFNHALGDIILCVDSDDYIEKNALEILKNYFVSENPDCICYNWQRTSGGKILSSKKEIVKKERLDKLNEILKRICSNSYYNSMCLKAFKKELLPKQKLIDYYKVRYGEDLIQSLIVLDSAKSVLFVPDVLYNYRVNLLSLSYNKSLERFSIEKYACPIVYSYLKKKNLFSDKDWEDYGMFCSGLLYGFVYGIAVADAPFKSKKEYFDKIRDSQYYKDFLHGKKTLSFAKNVFISLFEKKIDFLVVFLFMLLKKTKK